MKYSFALVLFLVVLSHSATAQASISADSIVQEPSTTRRFFVLPLITYSPETSLRLGAVGVYLFRGRKSGENTLLSSIRAPFSYTLNNQVKARLSFEIFSKENKNVFDGFAEWQRFPLFFYGIGPDTKAEDEEKYTSRTYGAALGYLKKVINRLYFGGRLEWISNQITDKEEGGLLSQEGLITGSDGGTVLGLGLAARFDRRDNNFNATTGSFMETSLTTYQKNLGSDFTFTKFVLDLRHFLKPFQRHVLALQFYTQFNWGDPPFESMALLGSDVIMRGHYLGRFRDNGYWAAQLEYRLPLKRSDWSPDVSDDKKLSFWERWGLVGFAGLGTVGPGFDTMWTSSLKYSFGLGIRFLLLPEEKVNFRLDFGFGTQTPGFYLNVREAF